MKDQKVTKYKISNYEILSINLFTILSWFSYLVVVVCIINLIKTLITGKRVND